MSYKTWKPTAASVSTMSAAQKKRNARENASWPSGAEGGRYDSGEGIRSSAFTVVWAYLGMLGRGYPTRPDEARKQHVHSLILSLGNSLPCGACRTNFNNNLAVAGYDPKIHLASRQALSRFMNKLHNTVNAMLGKPTFSYEEHRDFFEVLRAKCTPAKAGKEGGCGGALHESDTRPTCVIQVMPEADATRFISKNGGRMSMKRVCRLKKTLPANAARQTEPIRRSPSSMRKSRPSRGKSLPSRGKSRPSRGKSRPSRVAYKNVSRR